MTKMCWFERAGPLGGLTCFEGLLKCFWFDLEQEKTLKSWKFLWNGKSVSCPVYSNSSSSKICYFSKCKFIKFFCPISVFNDLIFFFRIFLISATAIQAWLWVLLRLSASSKVIQMELSLFARWGYSARQKKKQSKRQSAFHPLFVQS